MLYGTGHIIYVVFAQFIPSCKQTFTFTALRCTTIYNKVFNMLHVFSIYLPLMNATPWNFYCKIVCLYAMEYNPPSIFGTENENLKLVSQQYRTWSDWTDVHADLALYWWQRLTTYNSSRICVNYELFKKNRFSKSHWPALAWRIKSNGSTCCKSLQLITIKSNQHQLDIGW